MHDRRIVRDRIERLDFIRPPVAERRRARAVGRDLFGDFVSFKHMLQGADLESKLIGHAQQHQDLVRTVAVRMHVPLAFQYLDQRVEFEVALRFCNAFALGKACAIIHPLLLILTRIGEGLTDDILNAHARRRIACRTSAAAANVRSRIASALRIFSQRELDARRGTFKQDALRIFTPAHFRNRCHAANRVGAAMQNVRGGDAACECAIDRDVFGIEYIADANHRRDRHAAFVDRLCRDVRVRVNDAGDEVLSTSVDDLGPLRHHDFLAHLIDLAVFHHHRAHKLTFGHGPNRGVLDDECLGLQGRHCKSY